MLNRGDGRPVNPLARSQGLCLTADLPELDFAVKASSQQVVAVDGGAEARDTRWNNISIPAGHRRTADRRCRAVALDPMAIPDQVHESA